MDNLMKPLMLAIQKKWEDECLIKSVIGHFFERRLLCVFSTPRSCPALLLLMNVN